MNRKNESKTGCALIEIEREKHVGLGWDAEHDDTHKDEELRDAGIAYAVVCDDRADDPPACWPFEITMFRRSSDKARNLVKAGAFIAAEIDRLRRVFQSECNLISQRDFGQDAFDAEDSFDLNKQDWTDIDPEDFVKRLFWFEYEGKEGGDE